MNLIHSGTNYVTDELLVKLRSRRKAYCLWVNKWGVVTMSPRQTAWLRGAPPPDTDLVGVFTPAVPAKVVREALEYRLAEIRA